MRGGYLHLSNSADNIRPTLKEEGKGKGMGGQSLHKISLPFEDTFSSRWADILYLQLILKDEDDINEQR